MRSRFAKLFRWWPIGILLLLEAILFAANYKPGTFLMGWDNVMPEFHFKQALMTNLYGVWQEHRGLGLYDGMGHAANLVHTLFLWLLSLTLPTHLLRYTFHFLMHFLGGIGAYVLIAHLRGANFFHLGGENTIDKHNATALKLSINQWIGLAGALFYQYNLATTQMFYTPLEAFSVHFAALPWLAWGLLGYLTQPSRKTFFLFLLISLLSTPQFFIPTLLLPIGILFGSIAFARTLLAKLQGESLRRVITASLGFLLINAFWILPYLYGLPNNAPVIQAAKINQMSSDEVFARNQAFGDLGNVLRLRGFPLDFEDMSAGGTTTFLMAPWREFLQSPFVTLGSWILVAITILGIGMNGFLVPFIASLLFLANDTPLIKEATAVIRDSMPLLGEAYRFPFTKFSLLFAFSSSVFFTIGLARITKTRIVTIIVIGLIVILALPAFRGNFISDRLRVTLPDDYPRVFKFMKNKPLGRIAYLPQQQYWSWKYYRWGYRGSGFVWYGLSQPIMDRAFDPWSNENENYYWELSRSIYSKDVAAFEAVLAKYDVRYILFDENIISPSHNRALFTEEIKTMLASLPEIRETAQFGKLTVYERWIPDRVGDDVTVKTDLPLVSPAYQWTDNDVAYRELGDYISGPGGYTYPFRSLFTKRSASEREFSISDIPMDELVYDSTKSADLKAENVQPCGVLRDGTAMAENFSDTTSDVRTSFTSEVKNTPFLRFTSRNQRGCLSFGATDLPHRDGYLVAVESRHITGRPMLFSLINQTAKHVELETYLDESKVESRKSKVEDWQRDYFILPPLANDGLGYTVYLSNDAIGRQESINDIKSIKFYRIPYQELVMLRSGVIQPKGLALNVKTLVLSQAYDPGWTAWEKIPTFPYLRQLKNHVLVNNWSNGWSLPSNQVTNNELTIIVFFWPQLLQWLGFALLPLPFLWIWYTKRV